MFRRFARVFSVAVALASCSLASGCAKPAAIVSSASATPGTLRLGLVTDTAGLGDRGLNDGTYAGLRAANARFGAQIAVQRSSSPGDYQPNLTYFADQEYDATFGVGEAMRADVERTARLYPRRRFVIVGAVDAEPNVASVVFREPDGSFLAGALAASLSKTHVVGFLGGIDAERTRALEAGFVAGARELDRRTRVDVVRARAPGDAAAVRAATRAILAAHADVVEIAAGRASSAAFDALRANPEIHAIAVGGDASALARDGALTSVVTRADAAVFRIALETSAEKFPSGIVSFGYREGAVGLATLPQTRRIVGPQRLARLDAVGRAIASGRIVPPATREALAAFRPAAL